MGDISLAGLFSPFPTFFSPGFPFHSHLSYQVTTSFDLLLSPSYFGENESDVIFPLLTHQLYPLQVYHEGFQFCHCNSAAAAINLAELDRGLSATAVESRTCS